jgi:hypothetical protein
LSKDVLNIVAGEVGESGSASCARDSTASEQSRGAGNHKGIGRLRARTDSSDANSTSAECGCTDAAKELSTIDTFVI